MKKRVSLRKYSRRLTVFMSAVIMFLCLSSIANASVRQKSSFNYDWKFIKGSHDIESVGEIEDSKWEDVILPHDACVSGKFSQEESTSANGWLPFGQGCYLKHFRVDANTRGKKVFIQFEGVYRDAKVYINGKYLGRQLNGYLGFEYELSQYLKYGDDNEIVVTYDNTTKDTSRWYTGEGIYRDAWLVITDQLYVPQYGTYITTPVARADFSLVKVETDVRNSYEDRILVRLITEIYDMNGEKVAEAAGAAPVSSKESFKFRQEIEINDPKLWSCEKPNLYRAVSKVYKDDIETDCYETTFGIREIRMSPERGLLLNGEKIIAKGGNMHHDLGCLGSAAIEEGYERKLLLLKEMGCNSIRLSHNPHATTLLDAADRLGILVFDEAYDKWTSQYYGGVESFEDNWEEDITTFVKRDRNHPSVYIWSMGNEVLKQLGNYDKKYETADNAADRGVGLFKRMSELTRTLDPTRKVTVGLFPSRENCVMEWNYWEDYEKFTSSNPAEMAFYSDVVSWNYTGNMFSSDYKNYPQLAFIASETSTNLDFGTRKLSWLELDLDRVIGHYYWTATDYLGESVWPTKVWGRAFYDITDKITPIGTMYQCFYDDDPMVHIWVHETKGQLVEHFRKTENKRWSWHPMSDHWNWEGEETVKVQVMSNADEVELFLNENSLGIRKYVKGEVPYSDWKVPFEKGVLKAVARNNGIIVAEHVLTTAKEPVAVKLTPDVRSLKANGLDLAYIDVSLVDKFGITVPDADRVIHFEVEGSANLAGVANSDIFSNEPWVGNQKQTYKGRCMLVLRSTCQDGIVRVKATADGLPTGEIKLRCDN